MASFPDIGLRSARSAPVPALCTLISPLFHPVTHGVVVTAPRLLILTDVSVGAVEGGPFHGQVAGTQDSHHPPAPAAQADPRVGAPRAGQLTGEPLRPTLVCDLRPEARGLGAGGGEPDCGGGHEEGAPGLGLAVGEQQRQEGGGLAVRGGRVHHP